MEEEEEKVFFMRAIPMEKDLHFIWRCVGHFLFESEGVSKVSSHFYPKKQQEKNYLLESSST